MSETLAIRGGKPVRTAPLPTSNPGAAVYGAEERDAAARVVMAQSPFRYYGPNVLGMAKAFEKSAAEYLGTRHALGVTSGTAALMVALKAAGVGPGDKVIVPACTFIATPGAVICSGAVPVFCEIDDSLGIDPEKLEQCIDEHTKALITVPILGNPVDMDPVLAVTKKHGIKVIEDVAQSMGATYKGKMCGTMGDIGAFSLQINKLITTGEGGFVTTDDPKVYERAVRYHDHGMFREKEGFMAVDDKADIFVGQNYRMTELTGALASAQLEKLDGIIANMQGTKRAILEGIADLNIPRRRIVDEAGDVGSTIIFLLESKERSKAFREAMGAEGVPMGLLYNGEPIYHTPQILHRRTADRDNFPFCLFPDVAYSEGMCPASSRIMERNAMLNLGPTWTGQDVDDAVRAIRKVYTQL